MTKQGRRDITEKKIIEALRDQLAIQGFRCIGVNAVARRAGVSKELIYRYFGGVEPLLKAMMKEQDYWPSARYLKGTTEGKEPRQRVRDMILNQIAVLRSNDILREIRSWELVDNNELTNELATEREAASLEFLKGCGISADDDRVPQIALMLAGVLYLTIRSNTADSFMGIPLKSEAGWTRLEDAIESMCDTTMRSTFGD